MRLQAGAQTAQDDSLVPFSGPTSKAGYHSTCAGDHLENWRGNLLGEL